MVAAHIGAAGQATGRPGGMREAAGLDPGHDLILTWNDAHAHAKWKYAAQKQQPIAYAHAMPP